MKYWVNKQVTVGLEPVRPCEGAGCGGAQVVAHTHHLPRHWRGRAHTREVQGAFEALFPFKAVLLAEEMLSVLLTPFVLYFSLPACAGAVAPLRATPRIPRPLPRHTCATRRRAAQATSAARRGGPAEGLTGAPPAACSQVLPAARQLTRRPGGGAAGDIVAFVRDNTAHMEGLGDVCSLAGFDLGRHGNPRYGSPVDCPKVPPPPLYSVGACMCSGAAVRLRTCSVRAPAAMYPRPSPSASFGEPRVRRAVHVV